MDEDAVARPGERRGRADGGTAAHLHFCVVHPHVPYEQEYNIEPVSIRDRWPILGEQLQVVGGTLRVPDAPGLGVEVDEALVRHLATVTDVQPGL